MRRHANPHALQGKKRKDSVCIVLADDTVEEAKIRMNKVSGDKAAQLQTIITNTYRCSSLPPRATCRWSRGSAASQWCRSLLVAVARLLGSTA
jgi:hypothetical protein